MSGARPDLECEYCRSIGTLDLHVQCEYFHIYWIPFFPVGKSGGSVCRHCKQALLQHELPARSREVLLKLKSETRRPIFHFFGAAVVAFLIVLAIVLPENLDVSSSPKNTERLETLESQSDASDLNSPQSNQSANPFE